MTTPQEEQPATRAPGTPTVSTAPPRSRWRLGTVPSHVGPARTSTLVLAVLFVLVAALWIGVRPDPVQVAPTGGTGTVPVQQQPTTRAPTTAPRTTTTAPTTTAPASTSVGRTTSSASTPTTGPGSSSAPTGSPATSSSAPGTTTAPAPPVLPTTAGAPTS